MMEMEALYGDQRNRLTNRSQSDTDDLYLTRYPAEFDATRHIRSAWSAISRAIGSRAR